MTRIWLPRASAVGGDRGHGGYTLRACRRPVSGNPNCCRQVGGMVVTDRSSEARS